MQYEFERHAFPYDSLPTGVYARAIAYARTMPKYEPTDIAALTPPMLGWVNTGPINIGGRINAIAVNPLNANTIYIGAADGGVWKTYDEGSTWLSVFDKAPTQSMGALAIDPLDTNVVYAGTGEANFAGDSFNGLGIFKTTNGGETWASAGAATFPQNYAVASIVVNPRDPAVLYAAVPTLANYAEGGVYESTDAGSSWARIFTGIVHTVIVNPVTPANLYLEASTVVSGLKSSTHGIYSTTDGGATWTKDSLPGIDTAAIGRTALSLCDAAPNVVYAGVGEVAGTSPGLLGIFKTTDFGKTWNELSVPIDYLKTQAFYDNVIAVNPADPNKVFVAGVRAMFTTDGGARWSYIPEQYYNAGVVHSDHHAAAFNSQHPDTLYDGSDGGFFRGTANATSWTKRSRGLSITQFTGGALYPDNDAFLFGGTQDNGTLESVGANEMQETLGGDGGFTAVNRQAPNIIYSEQYDLSLYKSTDLGATWQTSFAGIPPTEPTIFYAPYAVDPLDGNNMYYGSLGIWKSADGASSWKKMNSCLFSAGFQSCYYISVVYVSPYNDSIVFAGSTGGGVARSTDMGKTWAYISAGLPQRYVSSIHATPNGLLYATVDGFGSGHLFRYTDSAGKWQDISANLPDAPANDVFVSGDTLVVGTMVGAFISADSGNAWSTFNAGLPSVSIQQFLYDPFTHILRAVTHGRGLYDILFSIPFPGGIGFSSAPDTTPMYPGQRFIYAPIVNTLPPLVFHIQSSDSSTSVDSLLGIVRWTARGTGDSVRLTVNNGLGGVSQSFYLAVHAAIPATDWRVVSSRETGKKTFQLAVTGRTTLWMTQDSGIAARSSDGGATWARFVFLADALGPVTGLAAIDSMTAFIGTWQGNIYKTTNGGAAWALSRSDPNMRYENLFFWNTRRGMALSVTEKDTVFELVTSDGGATWEQIPTHTFAYLPSPGTLQFLDSLHGWFASWNKMSKAPATIFYTTDGGATWTGSKSDCNLVGGIAFFNPTKGFAVDKFGGVVDETSDGGKTWSSVNIPPAGNNLCAIKTFPPTSIAWIAGNARAWISYDTGKSWTATYLVPNGPAAAAAFADTNLGWIAMQNNAVQQHTENPPVFVNDMPPVPRPQTLANYPNPFSVSTEIIFTAPAFSPHTTLKIYNALGECVCDLSGAMQRNAGGTVQAHFDASELADGVYFAVMRQGAERHVQTLVHAR